jgi:hypothetical protein
LDPLESLYRLSPAPGSRRWQSMKFTDFCAELERETGMPHLQDGMLVLCLVAFDGLEPKDLVGEQREIARQIFGPVDVIPPEARAAAVLVLVAGARGGKTYIVGALRILHLALTVPLDTLAPGEEAFGTIFSGDPRQREQCFRYALGAARSHPGIRAMIQGAARDDEDFTGSSFTLKRPDGEVTIESLPPKPGGGSGRGRSLVGALLEECAFFQDEDHKVNDVDVFKAVTPRILPGGQTILSSTPWAEAGLLYEEFVANHPDPRCAAPHLTTPGVPHRAIAAHAPTLLLRDVPFTRGKVAAERARDPENAKREYDAQFLAIGTSQFFDPARIAAAVDPTLALGRLPSRHPQVVRATGMDLGLVRDAAAAVSVERDPDGYAPLEYIEVFAVAQKLKPSEVISRIGDVAERAGTAEVTGDQHAAPFVREGLWGRKKPLVFLEAPAGNSGKLETYGLTRDLLYEGKLRLPQDPKLLQQLREVTKTPLPGGGMKIEQPRKPKGGHGDIVSALVAAVYAASLLRLPDAPEQLPDDPLEREAALWDRREDEQIAEELREQEVADWGYAPVNPRW